MQANVILPQTQPQVRVAPAQYVVPQQAGHVVRAPAFTQSVAGAAAPVNMQGSAYLGGQIRVVQPSAARPTMQFTPAPGAPLPSTFSNVPQANYTAAAPAATIQAGGASSSWRVDSPRSSAPHGRSLQAKETTRKKIILVDMDNTIAKFDKRAYEILQETYGTTTDEFSRNLDELNKHGFAANFEPGRKEEIYRIFSRPGFFQSLEPVEDAIESLTEMQARDDLEVFICTAPIKQSRCCWQEKIEWIRDKFGDDGDAWVGRVIITSDKTLVRGDILIDDAPEAKGETLDPSWVHVRFTQPYNARMEKSESGKNITRLNAWREWREAVLDSE